jgi:hypothetical protein
VVVGLAVVLVSFAIDTTVSVCTLNVCLTCFDFSFGHILVGITSLSQSLRHWKYMFVCCSYARLASSVLCVCIVGVLEDPGKLVVLVLCGMFGGPPDPSWVT